MAKQRVCVVLVDHGGDTSITLFEAWRDAKAWFEKKVADYNEEPGVKLEVSRIAGPRLYAENVGRSSYPFIECRKQIVDPPSGGDDDG